MKMFLQYVISKSSSNVVSQDTNVAVLLPVHFLQIEMSENLDEKI